MSKWDNVLIAFDPGASGGYAVQYGDGSLVAEKWTGEADFMEEIHALHEYISGRVIAVVEEVPKFVGRAVPSSSIFTLAKNYGFILGTLAAMEIPTHLVRPQVWQKGLTGVKKAKGAAKKRVLKEHATRLFPEQKPTLATADALMILHHAQQNMNLT